MLSINIVPVLVDKENSEGLCPVKLAVYIGKKRTYVSTGIRIKKDHWDTENRRIKKSDPLSTTRNTKILKQKQDLELKLLEMQNTGAKVSVASVRITAHSKSLTEYFEKLIEDLMAKYSPDTIDIYENELSRIKKVIRERKTSKGLEIF